MRVLSWLLMAVVLVGAALAIGGAAVTYSAVRQTVLDSPIDLPAFQPANQPTRVSLFITPTVGQAAATVAATSATAAPNATVAPKVSPSPTVPAWADPARITILLLGIDQRRGEKGPFRTDTIIVLSLDPVRKTAAMISIPRDIYLMLPDVKVPERINNANVVGETRQYPKGGPGLAVRTVESLLGISIQRYAVVNFDVFTSVIDAIAPIQVCPKDRIFDDKYPDANYGFMRVEFKPGCQDLDSARLLQYARVRHNSGDDFGRASRQQEVIRAVRERFLSMGGVSALLGKSGDIYAKIKDSIKTDLNFDEMVQLAALAQSIPRERIQSAVITPQDNYMLPATLPDGSQVFTPVYEKIHALVANTFDPAPVSAAAPQNAEENAVIVVSNGSGTDRMAAATATWLRGKSFTIKEARNADLPSGYGKTIIRVYTGKVKTAGLLADTLGISRTAIQTVAAPEADKQAGIDIDLIVGADLVGIIKP